MSSPPPDPTHDTTHDITHRPLSTASRASVIPAEIIRLKRDGGALDAAATGAFVRGLTAVRGTAGHWNDGQVAALAMAAFLNGLDRDETVALTLAMRDSGDVLTWDLDRPVVDKHSTGGVGDVVSLMLAPIVAACGVAVPMVSGRGLGHTGGTLDKMEAIPGYTAKPSPERFRRTVAEVGCAIIGQTGEIAPADARLYGIRDVTATVESVPLITASILSKKLAAGLGGLVLDVKVGGGAFMARADDARALARSLVEVAAGAGTPTVALLTAMEQPLAPAAGNAVETMLAVRYLAGQERPARLHDVTMALAAEMVALGDRLAGTDGGDPMARAVRALESGRAAETFGRMVAALGGPADLMERPAAHLGTAPVVREVAAKTGGTVTAVDARALGVAVVALGGGRTDPAADIDPAVGLTELAAIGEAVGPGAPLARVHARDEAAAAAAAAAVRAAYRIGGEAPAPTEAIMERVEAS